jgi:3-mercaptopyruvate sulfurtransferase SseA
VLIATLAWTGCDGVSSPDASIEDAATADGGSPDAASPDAGRADAGPGDAGASPDGSTPGPDGGPTPGTLPPTIAVSALTNVSSDDYAHNRWGLIEASTLETYATRWGSVDTAAVSAAPNGRPAHLAADARLVVLQLNGASRAPGESFVPSAPGSNVYVYLLDDFRFNQTRDTGLVSSSVRYQADGPTTDSWLARYGIDLSRDFVVFAVGENTASNGGFFQELARGVYWLSYWGADLRHLAIVNGTLQQNYDGALSSTSIPEGSISNGGFSVRDLRVDHTGLTIPLEDFLQVVDGELAARDVIDGFNRQFIIDARPTNQFNRTAPNATFFDTHPGQFITTAWSSSGPPSRDATGRAKSYVLYEGHVRGAVTFPWASLLFDAGGNNWKYRSRAELEGIFATAGYPASARTTTVIVSQCRTNFEVQVNGFAARVILGYPTVHFDGSLVEYFSLVSEHPDPSFNLAPTDPAYRFRTDIPTRSARYEPGEGPTPSTVESVDGVTAYNVPSGTGPDDRKVGQALINRAATTTRLALNTDREYKRR